MIQSRPLRAWDLWIAAGLVLAFGAAIVPQTARAPADEWMYASMARMVADGALPYRDFFFSHPPLHLLPAVLLERLLPASISASKLSAIAASVGTAALLFVAARRVSPLTGVAALLLWVSSTTVLVGAAQFTGLCEGVLLLSLALAAAPRLPRLAGIAVALCLGTSTLVGAVALVWLAAWVLSDVRQRWSAALACATVLGLGALLCAALFGRAFFEQVYLSPLGRPSEFTQTSRWLHIFVPVVRSHLAWLAAIAVTLGAALWRKLPELQRSELLPRLSGLGAGLCVLGLFSSVHDHYAVILLPFAVLLAADGAQVAVDLGTEQPLARTALCATIATLLLLQMPASVAQVRARTANADRAAHRLQSTVRALRGLLAPRARLLGDSNLAPLLAMELPRPLWHREADTNTKRFREDSAERRAFLAAVAADPPEVIVLLDRHGLALMAELRDFVVGHYEKPWMFELSRIDRVLVFVRPGSGSRPPP